MDSSSPVTLALGGAMFIYASGNLTINNSIISNNSAGYGAGVYLQGLSSLAAYVQVTIVEGTLVEHNWAVQCGGFINSYIAGDLLISNSLMRHNSGKDAGVLFAEYGGTVTIIDCVAVDNRAVYGGFVMLHNHGDLTIYNCTMSFNVATREGGCIYHSHEWTGSLPSSAVITNSSLAHSVSLEGGGGIYGRGTQLVVSGCTIRNNSASQGGGILIEGAELRLERSELVDNRADKDGGALYAVKGSIAMVTDSSVLARNTASAGGGVALGGHSHLSVHNVTLAWNAVNHSPALGGSLWLDDGAEAIINGSVFKEGRATDGGGIALGPSAAAIRVERSRFSSLTAKHGGAIFFLATSNISRALLYALQFESNEAIAGPNIWWEYYDAAVGLDCLDCSVDPPGSPLLASSTASHALMVGKEVVSTAIPAFSGEAFTPMLNFVSLDFYGSIVKAVASRTIVATAEDQRASLSGQTVSVISPEEDSAEFVDLIMYSHPGRDTNMTFSALCGVDDTGCMQGSLTVTVAMAACGSGSQHLEMAQVCQICAQGTLKLSNNTQPCWDCADIPGLTCHGGAMFTVQEGWWLATSSIRLCAAKRAVLEEPISCLLDRIYECDVTEACPPTESLNGTWKAMCGEGYRSDVVLCGACESGYQMRATGRCEKCRVNRFLRFLHLAVPLAMVVAAARLLLGQHRASMKHKLHRRMRHSRVMRGVMCTRKIFRLQSLFSLFLNYMQVLGQQVEVLPQAAFPDAYKYVVHSISLNLNLIRWLGLQCIISGDTSDAPVEESLGLTFFELEFILLACLLIAIILPMGIAVTWNTLTMARRHVLAASVWGSTRILSRGRYDRNFPKIRNGHRATSPQAREQSASAAASSPLPQAAHCAASKMDASDATWQINVAYANTEPGALAPAGASSVDDRDDVATLRAEAAPPLSICKNRFVQWVEAPRPAMGNAGGNPEAMPQSGLTPAVPSRDSLHHAMRPKDLVAVTGRSGVDQHGAQAQQEDLGESGVPSQAEHENGHEEARLEPPGEYSDYEVIQALYCSVATFLLVLIHPAVSTAAFQVFYCDNVHWLAMEPTYWHHLGRMRQCYVSPWGYVAAISTVLIITFVFGMPAGLILLTRYYHGRKQVTLNGRSLYVRGSSIDVRTLGQRSVDPEEVEDCFDEECRSGVTYMVPLGSGDVPVPVWPVFAPGATWGDGVHQIQNLLSDKSVMVYLGPYVRPWKEKYFYWQGCDVMMRLSYTGVVILVKITNTDLELVYTCMASVIVLAIQAYCCPYVDPLLNQVQVLVAVVHAISICAYMAQYYVLKSSNDAESIALGIALVVMQYGIATVLCVRIAQYTWLAMREENVVFTTVQVAHKYYSMFSASFVASKK
ncbi:hypothetical protein CYMTET_15901 [Cymbomonas tetramitiformis]|uniref:Right handed beta helix domain-containing protein n=1 Tax=Cymbomonas tetramitiformis TaxID=36881 RepID=A0AAE0L8G3_9CHLO|nr:hypothetical protein CYMTET_15901 [Cymbomonas tetramitiformis]